MQVLNSFIITFFDFHPIFVMLFLLFVMQTNLHNSAMKTSIEPTRSLLLVLNCIKYHLIKHINTTHEFALISCKHSHQACKLILAMSGKQHF